MQSSEATLHTIHMDGAATYNLPFPWDRSRPDLAPAGRISGSSARVRDKKTPRGSGVAPSQQPPIIQPQGVTLFASRFARFRYVFQPLHIQSLRSRARTTRACTGRTRRRSVACDQDFVANVLSKLGSVALKLIRGPGAISESEVAIRTL
jgi:hypothetical protein